MEHTMCLTAINLFVKDILWTKNNLMKLNLPNNELYELNLLMKIISTFNKLSRTPNNILKNGENCTIEDGSNNILKNGENCTIEDGFNNISSYKTSSDDDSDSVSSMSDVDDDTFSSEDENSLAEHNNEKVEIMLNETLVLLNKTINSKIIIPIQIIDDEE